MAKVAWILETEKEETVEQRFLKRLLSHVTQRDLVPLIVDYLTQDILFDLHCRFLENKNWIQEHLPLKPILKWKMHLKWLWHVYPVDLDFAKHMYQSYYTVGENGAMTSLDNIAIARTLLHKACLENRWDIVLWAAEHFQLDKKRAFYEDSWPCGYPGYWTPFCQALYSNHYAIVDHMIELAGLPSDKVWAESMDFVNSLRPYSIQNQIPPRIIYAKRYLRNELWTTIGGGCSLMVGVFLAFKLINA